MPIRNAVVIGEHPTREPVPAADRDQAADAEDRDHGASRTIVVDLNPLAIGCAACPEPVPQGVEHSPPRRTRSEGHDNRDENRMAALLRLAKRGDGEAFARIYDSYVDEVYRYVFHRVGSPALAEELTSETFLRALRRLDSFPWHGRDVGVWFITMARNVVNDHLKSARFRRDMSDMAHADHADRDIQQVAGDPGHGAVALDALKGLRTDHQECLVLRFLQGLSVAETAKVMGRSEDAIKQLQLRAMRSLARVLDRRSEGGGRDPTRSTSWPNSATFPSPGVAALNRLRGLG